MFSITLKMMRKNLRMLIPAGIAILIGSAFIAATFLFGNALNASLASNATSQYASANYIVSRSNPESEDTATLDIAALEKVEGIEGVRPDVSGMQSIKKNSKSSTSVTLPLSTPESLMPVGLSEGEWPTQSGEIVITAAAARRLDVKIGDSVTVPVSSTEGSSETSEDTAQTQASADLTETVVGLSEDTDGAFSYSGGAFVFNTSDFYTLMHVEPSEVGTLTSSAYLLLDTSDAAETENITSRVKAVIGSDYKLQTRQAAAAAQIEAIGQGQNVVTTFLLIFGVIALLVAGLVIANTFQVLVAQRRRTLALLRTIGAKKGQLYRSVLLESAILGTVSAALGVGVALFAMWILSVAHVDAITGSNLAFIPDWRVFVLPIAFGVFMTVVASLGSARMATSVTPLEALRPMELSARKKSSVARALFSIALILGGTAMAVVSVIQVRGSSVDTVTEPSFTLNLGMAVGGGVLLFLGFILSAVWWLPMFMKGAGKLASLTGPSARIASANVAKNPRRVAATGVALLIGVTLVTAISTGAASAKQTLNASLSDKYTVDVQVEGSDLDEEAARKISDVDGVEAAALIPKASSYNDKPYKPTGNDTTDITVYGIQQADRKKLMRSELGEVEPGTIVMNAKLPNGDANPFKDGERVSLPMVLSDGTEKSISLKVSLQSFDSLTYTPITALVEPEEFTLNGVDSSMRVIWARVGKSASSVQTMSDLQDAVADYPQAFVGGTFATRVMWETSVDTVMTILVGLLAVSVIIALIGVANTLSLSVIERTRESATLRAIGMTRRQLRTSLGIEALMISVVAGIAGLVLGIGFGWLGSTVVLWTIGTPSFRVDTSMCIAVMVIAILAALISSIAPARRAVKAPPVEALAEA